MTESFSDYPPRSVALLPDATEYWKVYQLAELGADLFVAPDCPPNAATRAVLAADSLRPIGLADLRPSHNAHAQHGGKVYRDGSLVVKLFDTIPAMHRSSSVSRLIANVAAQVGLERVSNYPEYAKLVTLSAPRIHAAVVPHDDAPERVIPTQVMDLAPGSSPIDVPARQQIDKRLQAAFASCAFQPDTIDTDNHSSNILVERALIGRRVVMNIGRLSHMTKLDVAPRQNVAFQPIELD